MQGLAKFQTALKAGPVSFTGAAIRLLLLGQFFEFKKICCVLSDLLSFFSRRKHAIRNLKSVKITPLGSLRKLSAPLTLLFV